MSAANRKIPLAVWILAALALGLLAGWLFPGKTGGLKLFSDLVLAALRLLATPLIFCAVILALVRAQINGRSGLKLGWLLASNTLVAIGIGLLVSNTLQPGAGAGLPPPTQKQHAFIESKREFDVVEDLIKKFIPRSVGAPLVENDVLALVVLAVALGLGLRAVKRRAESTAMVHSLEGGIDVVFQTILVLLHGLFYAVPPAVFCVVAAVVGNEGFGAFASFGKFVVAVIAALALQAAFYLVRVRLGSWIRPGHLLKHSSEALAVAFSTASSTATLPVTYRCATEKMGLREESARLGAMVGGNLNNDGTALYEAMAALFIAQALGMQLGLGQQAVVVVMAVVASVGAAGIPEAGLVTMMAVFSAVKLPIDYIPLLLTVDWFLDRCRTAINVMGDLSVSCLLDGKMRHQPAALPVPPSV
ncbi:MAG: dicarboxylate/amino acid:cation symporter [Verrucomicrobiales bacterium]|nr:dicarboxylate/amino acid:cation symporter [Verrucomicrobiales bacterium]